MPTITHRLWPLVAASILLPMHLKLERSSPKADETLAKAPTAVQLWFSQKVEMPATKVSVSDAAKHAVAVEQLRLAEDGSVVAPITAALASGRYTVSWRTMSSDGHVVKGEFGFSVR